MRPNVRNSGEVSRRCRTIHSKPVSWGGLWKLVSVLYLLMAVRAFAIDPPSLATFSAPRQYEQARPAVPRDHVCGGGIPDCAACCGVFPGGPGNCIEVSGTDCVVIHNGNPQEPGSDCHDFNGNGSADECEPEFPFCLPSNDRLTCEGACPGPLPCNATKVRVNFNTGGIEVLECGCRFCRVCLECDAFPPPCVEACPSGSTCVSTQTCYGEICDITCICREQGAWDPPFDWGLPGKLIVPIHATVVPVRDASGRLRGQVFAYDDHVEDHNLHTYLWDPSTGAFTQYELPVIAVARDCPTPPPPADGVLFCSGHSVLADGKLLITGGHIVAADLICPNGYAFSGHESAHTFDAVAAGSSDPWARVQDMRQGRWYPTNCALPDGRVLTASGFDSCGFCDGAGNPISPVNPDLEIYSPPSVFSAGGWSLAGQHDFPLYPWFHLLSNGAVFYSGPGTDARLSHPPYDSWPVFAYSMLFPFRGAGTSVLMAGRRDSVMVMGGGCTGCGPFPATTNTTEVADVFSLAPPHWDAGPTMNHPRRHLNAVLLPDGTVLAVGGRSDSEDPAMEPTQPVYEAELYDPLGPSNAGWRRMAAMTRPRMYHSTALLLPDGRVLSAGGTYVSPSFPSEENAEIYSPPYLFRGPRPAIMSAPESVGYGQEFAVLTPSPSAISSVVLMRPGSVTHSVNMEQRHVALEFQLSPIPEALMVRAPASGELAPPGYYMLFILNAQRVPSEAAIIRLSADEACCEGFLDPDCQNLPASDCTTLGGTPLGPGSVCRGTGSCCYDITDDLCPYDTCIQQDGACCAANGGIFQGVGSVCEIQACCIDGLCCNLDSECCIASGGVPSGPEWSCAGAQGACCYDGDGDSIPEVCIVADALCCANLGGIFHGDGTTCSPNFGACCFGFTGGSCTEMNESCCADLEASTFMGPGSMCLGDPGGGFDPACKPGSCQPDPNGLSCTGLCLPNEFCRPKKIRRDVDGRHLIIECDCVSTFTEECHVELNPNNPDFGQPVCVGICPAGEVCDLVSSGGVRGTIDYMCMCRDENTPIPCGPNSGMDACYGSCPPGTACVPTVVRHDPINPGLDVVVSCGCGIPDFCHTALDNSGAPSCPGFCPGPIACNPYTVPTPAFGEHLQCACFTEACCFPSGRCQALPPELCRAAGGIPRGPGTRCRRYADISPKPEGDGNVDLNDILKVLDGFADPVTYPNADIYPCNGGDGNIDLDDILAVLDAFSGLPPCPDGPCP